MLTEEKLLADFQSGRIELFYEQLYPQLLLYAARLLDADYAFLAEDCVQDVVFKAYNVRSSFKSVPMFKAYLYKCIHNEAVSVLRKHMARENYLSSTFDEADAGFLNGIIEQETITMLYQAIRQLPEKYSLLFHLSFEKGLKNAEVAKLLQISESAVKKQKMLFIELMRQKLKANSDILVLLCFISIVSES